MRDVRISVTHLERLLLVVGFRCGWNLRRRLPNIPAARGLLCAAPGNSGEGRGIPS